MEHLCASEFGKGEHSRRRTASSWARGSMAPCGWIGTAMVPCPQCAAVSCHLSPRPGTVPLDVTVGMWRWVVLKNAELFESFVLNE